ncbi:Kynurenine formamidase [Pseudomonas gessardii]|uniref:Cyclase family protein n=1 Tax=Pseudomonas gessardii TaxID=78544 RepID=A0ABS9FHX3_9PSED|nr:cyclase family protein [Pseudomonas gessardii]MCF5088252.1 cyclase family protein [Pseudomonas gessardii]MCF5111007.1 cyclase family protein [Pseudomonas gessardii]MRU53516.1 cyclase family protein [Pseudomonas gessardii]SDQ61005.1 Kynurenine formamidase [Pseudomonas gessardii]
MSSVKRKFGISVWGLGLSILPIISTPALAENLKDQIGMARHLGTATWARCALELEKPGAKAFELSHERANEMPQAKFAENEQYRFDAPHGLPNTRHGFNTESVQGNIGGQGTQIDALGHFGYLPFIWDGKGEFPKDKLKYYGGWTHQQIKPTDDSRLQALGIEKVPPIVTSAILLDAARYLNNGKRLNDNQIISQADIEGMLKAQGLAKRGLLPGDMLLIYTGWGKNWDEAPAKYYTQGPGLGYDAALYLQQHEIVAVALDNPFTDPAPKGMLDGTKQPEGTPKGLPFAIHHNNLTQAGIYQIQNAKLDELAENQVWSSCAIVLPLKIKGGAQSPVRPIAIGAASS